MEKGGWYRALELSFCATCPFSLLDIDAAANIRALIMLVDVAEDTPLFMALW